MATAEAVFFQTTGTIARELGVPIHKVEYAIITRKIPHAQMAAHARLFDPGQVERIKQALEDIGK